MMPNLNLWLIPVLPLIGAALNGLFGKRLTRQAVASAALAFSGAAFGLALFVAARFSTLELPYVETVAQWIRAGNFRADFAFDLDQLSLVMLLVVTGVGFLIHIYSLGYMWEEGGFYRFFSYLNLFMFFMLTLVLANNYLVMFIGWEGVGLASYLLIGFFFLRDSAASAGKKAFIVNRVGDFGFLIALFLLIKHFGSLDFMQVFQQVSSLGPETTGAGLLTAIGLLLMVGAAGKSAQLPLYVWLPDAMEGPTPVSALIHAATMVTAGGYMVARSHVIYQMAPQAMTVVAVIGAGTAFFAASIGLVQNGIKRVLAYSTESQLGYMFLALGVGAFAAGIFHLMTHAFFKALLFLGSGSVINAMHHEQDMRKMGALKKKIPVTFWTMFIGTLTIAGTPFLAGFFSKDEILWKAFSSNQGHVVLWLIGAAVAGMTAFYMFRLIFMTFYGQSRVDHHIESHIHESPRSMTVPLIVLAIGSVLAGYVGFPAWLGGNNAFEKFLDPVFEPLPIPHGPEAEYSHLAEAGMAAASVAIALIGFGLAYSKYCKRSWEQQREIRQYGSLYPVFLNKYYVDEGYDFLFVNRAKDAGTGLWKFDAAVVDGAVNGSAWTTVEGALGSGWWDRWIVDGIVKFIGGFIRTMSWPLRLIQTGYGQNYALVIILGLLIFIGYVLWGTS